MLVACLAALTPCPGQEATQLLCHFLRADALQRLVRPFMSAIVDSLPLQVVNPLARLAACPQLTPSILRTAIRVMSG